MTLLLIDYGLVAIGIVLILLALRPISTIISVLGETRTRTLWRVLRYLVWLFIAGYAGYIALGILELSAPERVVSLIFFGGGWFVFLVCRLSMQTIDDMQRIAHLERENATDPLTGLFNRRHLDTRLTEELERCKRYGLPLSVMMIDADHFKAVNDNHGHAVGDAALKALALVVRESARESDVAARYGGEEFAMVLPNTSAAGAMGAAERIRERISRLKVHDDSLETPLSCTVSIGVAEYRGDETAAADNVVHRADKALYAAKQQGRNRVVLAD